MNYVKLKIHRQSGDDVRATAPHWEHTEISLAPPCLALMLSFSSSVFVNIYMHHYCGEKRNQSTLQQCTYLEMLCARETVKEMWVRHVRSWSHTCLCWELIMWTGCLWEFPWKTTLRCSVKTHFSRCMTLCLGNLCDFFFHLERIKVGKYQWFWEQTPELWPCPSSDSSADRNVAENQPNWKRGTSTTRLLPPRLSAQ